MYRDQFFAVKSTYSPGFKGFMFCRFLLNFDLYFNTIKPEGGILPVGNFKVRSFLNDLLCIPETLWIFLTFSSDYFLGEKNFKILIFERVKHFYTGDKNLVEGESTVGIFTGGGES